MSDELKQSIEQIGTAVNAHKSAIDEQFKAKSQETEALRGEVSELKSALEALETKGNRPGQTDAQTLQTEHKQAFGQFLRKGADDGLEELQTKAVSVGVEADGGYAVPEELDTNIEKLATQANPMRQLCTVMSVSNENYKKLVNTGGAGSGWVGETDNRPGTATPKLEQLAPTFGEIYANPAATQKSLDDLMFNVEQWLAEEVGIEFAEKENAAFVAGDGTNKPKGILAGLMTTEADGVRAFGTIQYRLTGTDGELGANTSGAIDNLIDLTFDLKDAYSQNAAFMVSRDVLRKIRKLKDADGNPIWERSLQAGQPSMLLGYPVYVNEDLPAAAAESNSVLFGDFKRAYAIVDVQGTRVLRDPYTAKPHVHFYTTKRVGGLLVNSEAIKVLRLGNGA